MILRPTALRALADWERAHKVALLAESSVRLPPGGSTSRDVASLARDLRAEADDLFEVLIERNAFGWLDEMPELPHSQRAALNFDLFPTSPAPL
jgi:hypothetical protein